MKKRIFAANWKMHLGPGGARRFLDAFLQEYRPSSDREVWFFPSAVALEAVVERVRDHSGLKAGVQNVYWESKGAFTGELSVPMAREAGAVAALVGHSERRHVFGETDEDTARKAKALIAAGLTPLLCVGEKIEEREAGKTLSVVERQLGALDDLGCDALAGLTVAYEPVWAIGTGRTATPSDAAEVHAAIRAWFGGRGVPAAEVRVLYGGSVNVDNVGALVSEPEIDGVLVGGASLDPATWLRIAQAGGD